MDDWEQGGRDIRAQAPKDVKAVDDRQMNIEQHGRNAL